MITAPSALPRWRGLTTETAKKGIATERRPKATSQYHRKGSRLPVRSCFGYQILRLISNMPL